MRILLANKFYYRRGGDCIYTINLEKLLRDKGHDTAIFSMSHPENIETIWNEYFPSEISYRGNINNAIKAIVRPFGTIEVKNRFTKLIRDFKPDIIHLNNIHTQLSPILAEIAYKHKVKVVWTIHDYKLLCPRYDCLCHGKDLCERCFTNKLNVIKYRCLKNSFPASIIAYFEAIKWNKHKLEKYTDIFITPSKFIENKMLESGFEKSKIKTLCHFINTNNLNNVESNIKDNYYCFVGRLSHEKGVNTLIRAANTLPYRLIIVGGGELENSLKKISNSNIEFVGFKDWDNIKEIVSKAKFCVIPSEWYEVLGLVAIESQCLGTPILAARIGGIPELIEEEVKWLDF